MTETDHLKKMLGLSDDRETTQWLLNHFTLFAMLVLLNDYCKRQDQPQETAANLMMRWSDGVIKQFEQEMKQVEEISATTMGKLFSSISVTPEEIRTKFDVAMMSVTTMLELGLLKPLEESE
jgi:hypothetical protein